MLSGDVHHAYLAEIRFSEDGGAGVSAVYQAVCSPLRNPLDARERRVIRFGCSRVAAWVGRAAARLAGVPAPPVRWTSVGGGPWFDNQIATLDLEGRSARLRIEKAVGEAGAPRLDAVLDRRLV